MRAITSEYDTGGLVEIAERRGTRSLKWDTAPDPDVLPLWIADMDFKSPKQIQEAVAERAAHGVFGYTLPDEGFFVAFRDWAARYQGWEFGREQQLHAVGMMPAIRELVLGLTAAGDGIIIQPPVYHPFASTVRDLGRRLAENNLVLDEQGYQIDFPNLEALAAEPTTKLLLLCSPHNPVGRIWTREELVQILEICLRNGVIVLADEIHADFVLGSRQFVPAGSLGFPNLVALQSPGKTFNIPSMNTAQAIVADPELRKSVKQAFDSAGYGAGSAMGLAATEAGYRHGRPWLEAVLELVRKNFGLLDKALLASGLPLKRLPADATYLAWVQADSMQQALGLTTAALQRRILKDAGVWLSPGSQFGPPGEGFLRFNLACAPETILEAVDRLKKWWEDLEG